MCYGDSEGYRRGVQVGKTSKPGVKSSKIITLPGAQSIRIRVWNNSLKAFDRMLFLYYDGIRLLAGHQKSTDEYVQYCIT